MKKEKEIKTTMEEANEKRLIPLVDKEWKGSSFLFVPIYNQMVLLFVGTLEDLVEAFKDATLPEIKAIRTDAMSLLSKGCDTAGCVLPHGMTMMIRVKSLCLQDENDLGTFCHESLHAAIQILRNAGVSVDDHGEALTYLHEFIVKRLVKGIKDGTYSDLGADGRVHPHDPNKPIKV